MNGPLHYGEELQELLDGRLDSAVRERVQEHLDSCARCRRELEAYRAVKETARAALSKTAAGPELSAVLKSALDREPSGPPAADLRRRAPFARRAALVASLAVLALILLLVYMARPRDLVTRAAQDYARYRAGRLPLQLETGDTAALEGFFSAKGIRFRTRVFDLGMMRFHLVGGRVHELGGRPSAFFVYQGDGNRTLICQMYRASVRDLPAGGERIEHDGIVFHRYRRDTLTEVFWQEGDITCVLVSNAPPDQTLSLAFAKAIKV